MVCLQGYLEFYVKTKNIRRAPFYILSVGNAVLMIVVMILHDLCDNNTSCSATFTKVQSESKQVFELTLPPCRWTTCEASSHWSP